MKRRLPKALVAVTLSLVLTMLFIPTAFAGTGITKAGNPALYNAIVAAKPGADANTNDILEPAELQALTGMLDIYNKGITSLAGMEDCTHITDLRLERNSGLADLTPLAGLTSLTSLYAGETAISDITPLAGLINLTNLNLTNAAALHNVDAVTGFTHLSTLTLGGVGLTGFPADMSALTSLGVLNIENIPGIASLPNYHAAITSIPHLRELDLSGQQDLSFLHGASSDLAQLFWTNSSLTPADLATLSTVTQLRSLSLFNDNIGNGALATLAGLHSVTGLYLAQNNISDLSGLSGATQLAALSIASNHITDLSPLMGLTNITSLNFCYNTVKDISPLSGMSSLYYLRCDNNYISDLSALAGKSIHEFQCDYNYLDPTPGSADRAVIDGIADVTYSPQYQITVKYNCDAAKGTPSKATEVVYYGQNLTTPAVTLANPSTTRFLGWDTNNDGVWDHAAGATLPFTWPTLPVNSGGMNKAAYTACFRDVSADSTLTALASTQPVSPAFSPATLNYTVSLPKAVGAVTLTPAAAAYAAFTIDGAAVASKEIAVANGQAKDVSIVVTAEDGTHTSTYTVTVTREPLDTNSLLTGIALSPSSLTLSPAFEPSQLTYTVTLPTSVGAVTLTPAKPAFASMTIDGAAVADKTISLYYGDSQTVKIAVTAENNSSTEYTVLVKRSLPGASKLLRLGNSAGTCSPAFDPYKTSYTLTLGENTASVKLTPVKAKSTSRLYINGSLKASRTFTLKPGKQTTVTIKVVPKTGAATVYKVVIKRKPISNAYLKSLTAGYPLSPSFNKSVYSYTVNLPVNKSGVTVKAVKADASATVTINGSRTSCRYISVGCGQSKTVKIVVKAQAGNTKTYTVILKRPPKP